MSELDLDFIKAMVVLFAFFCTLTGVAHISDDTQLVNVTEEVTYKDISHVHRLGDDDKQYNIYTTNNSFEVTLDTFNQIKVGDNLTVEYPDFGSRTLYYNNHIYLSD